MASSFRIKKKNKGYTLLEMAVVILLFSILVAIITSVYLTLVNASITANDYYQALENTRLGTEKIWRTLKYGWSFEVINTSTLRFKKKDCATSTITFNSSTKELLYFEEGIGTSSVFDSTLVKVNDFRVATDTPNTSQRYAYFQYAPKFILLYYELELRSKRGATTSLIFEQGVAPLNSVYSTNLCE